MAGSVHATLPLPPSANHLFANRRNGGRVKTPEYLRWIEEAGWHLKTAWSASGKPELDDQPMQLTISVGLVDRHRDISNTAKAIEDLLCRCLPVPDDKWNDRVVIERDSLGDNLARVRLEPLDTT